MTFPLVIIGGGRIGGAFVSGLVRAEHWTVKDLCVIEPSSERRVELETLFPGLKVEAALSLDHVGPTTGAILCVKPEQAEASAKTAGLCGVTRLLSVVAGLSTVRIEAAMPGEVAVVRAMPNTPVLIGQGASAMAGGSHVHTEDLEWAEKILGSLGVVVRLPERHLDAVTGLSGPMPAYLYLVVEALIEAGVHQGLTQEISRQLVIATFAGAGALLQASGESPEVLRAQVTSPGGPTAAGIRMLEGRAVRASFLEAVAAATERSRQLGR